MKCIFCLNEIDSLNESTEHIFPQALGGTWTTDKVCSCCNSLLGTKIDAKLIEHFLVKRIRIKLDLETAQGELPKLAEHGNLSDDENIKIQLQHDKKGHLQGFGVFTKTDREQQGEDTIVKIIGDPGNKSGFYRSVRKHLKRNDDITMRDDEINNYSRVKDSESPVAIDVRIDVFNCGRALLKIAYEVANELIGTEYMMDSTALLIRQFLKPANTSSDFYRLFRYEDLSLPTPDQLVDLNQSFGPENVHKANLVKHPDVIVCDVSVFSLINASIVVSEQPQIYASFDPIRVIVDPVNKYWFKE